MHYIGIRKNHNNKCIYTCMSISKFYPYFRFPKMRFVLQGYGLTETTGAMTSEIETMNKQGSSSGKITPGNVIKVQITQAKL